MELFDKYIRLPSAMNVHYLSDSVYKGLLQRSMDGRYAQSLQQLLNQEQHQELERMLQTLTPKETWSQSEESEASKKK